jgi:hypothetical protein
MSAVSQAEDDEAHLPQWFVVCIDAWYSRLAKLPSDFDRDVAFFAKTGNDVEGLSFWDSITHRPVHSASCMCGITSPSMYACGSWKTELLTKTDKYPGKLQRNGKTPR